MVHTDDAESVFRYEMQVMPVEVVEHISAPPPSWRPGTQRPTWRRIDEERMSDAVTSGAYIEATRSVIERYGRVWFNDESYVIFREAGEVVAAVNDTITAVRGVEVGHWTSVEHGTGVTVLVFPEPNTAAVEVRGAAPGSRETALLGPEMRVEQIQALVFAGGSAFGLAAADGGGGGAGGRRSGAPDPQRSGSHSSRRGCIRPGPAFGVPSRGGGGRRGLPAALAGSGADGPGGGGGGASPTSQWRGPRAVGPIREWGRRPSRWTGFGWGAFGGGQPGGRCVYDGRGAPHRRGSRPRPARLRGGASHQHHAGGGGRRGPLGRTDLLRLCFRSQDAVAVCIRPAHTRYDGDAAFAVSCGEAEGDPDALGEAAFAATGRAIAAAATASRKGLNDDDCCWPVPRRPGVRSSTGGPPTYRSCSYS